MTQRAIALLVFALRLSVCGLLSACATPIIPADDPSLLGKIIDARTDLPVSRDELFRRAAGSHFVILGEVHDNAIHHQLQAEILASILRQGRSPALAMEQFDREHQPALEAARAAGEREAERIADAGRFDRKSWQWPDYKPLVQIAASNGLTIIAANLSRSDARALMRSGRRAEGIEPASPEIQAELERDIVDGHCGFRPPAPVLSGMVEAQRARDAMMAKALTASGTAGAVLIAGAGHARRDRGVPAYLPPGLREKVLSIGFLEVEPSEQPAANRFAGLFDLVWFTPRAEREDPCKNFRLQQ